MKILSPTVDIAFKKIFGSTEHQDLLISFINAVIDPSEQISEVTLKNPYTLQNFKDDRYSILDILAKTSDGRKFNIEIQINYEGDYSQRALYYWSKVYFEQRAKSDYSQLVKTIGIHVLCFNAVQDSKEYHNIFHISGKNNNSKYFDNLLELHTIEFNKFSDSSKRENFPDLMAKVKNSLDEWAAFLSQYDLLEENNVKLPHIQHALEVLKAMALNQEEREFYDASLKKQLDENSKLREAEEKGREEGREKGREKGREEGVELGEKKMLLRPLKN